MVDSSDNFIGDIHSDDKLKTNSNVINEIEEAGRNDRSIAGLSNSSASSSQTLVTARGTGEGLIVRLNTKKGFEALKVALEAFLISRKSFLTGNHVTIEWIGDSLTEDETEEVVAFFKSYKIGVRKPQSSLINDTLALTSKMEIFDTPPKQQEISVDHISSYSDKNDDEMIGGGLFGGIDNIRGSSAIRADNTSDSLFSVKTSLRENINFDSNDHNINNFEGSSNVVSYERIGVKNLNHSLNSGNLKVEQYTNDRNSKSNNRVNSSLDMLKDWDEADTRSIFTTLRSGQKIETEHSVVILGDINSGAEVIAGGDIFVLGALRGVAHAGAFDETGGGRVIMALDLQPTQLRIGTVISRGVGESTTVKAVSSSYRVGVSKANASKLAGGNSKGNDFGCAPEVAYIDGTSIVVEPYNSKSASQRGVNTSNR